MAFDPGLRQSGIHATRQAYPDGAAGIRLSLDTMAQRIREGRLDPRVRGWAIGALKSAGIDGRSRTSTRAQVGALLDAYRAQTSYAGDPTAAEYVQSAAATLCLGPNLCLNGGDCDDGSVALASAIMSIGIPAVIVKQSFGRDAQEHVLVAAQCENGEWIYADPSTRLPVGSSVQANEEVWVDPLEPIGNLPAVQAEIVSLGAPRKLQAVHGKWCEERHGKVWLHYDGRWQALGVSKPAGVGLIFGNHTANELSVDLLNWQGFVTSLATSIAENYDKWKSADAAGYEMFRNAWNSFRAKWDAAATAAQQTVDAAKNSWRGLNWTIAEDEYQTVLQVYQNGLTPSPGGFDDLATQWADAMRKYGGPQPDFKVALDPNAAPDADLVTYKSADQAIKAAENAASGFKDPAKVALVSALIGAALAVTAVVVVKKVL
jgi:hypothetical protein